MTDNRCWHTEPNSPCDWNACRQPERLAAGDPGTDPARTPGVEGPGPFMACEDCHSPHTCAETRDIDRCP